MKDLFGVQGHGLVIPPGTRIKRVRNEHFAVGRHPDIIGAVEVFALIILDQNSYFFVGRNGPKLVFLIGAGDEISFAIHVHPIGAA